MGDEVKQHKCEGMRKLFKTEGWTLKNKGDGWYMYDGEGNRSPRPHSFCTQCDARLESA